MICQHGNRRALCIECHPPVNERPNLGHEDVSVTVHPGLIEVAAMVDGRRVSRRYMGFGGRRAVRMFLVEMNAAA